MSAGRVAAVTAGLEQGTKSTLYRQKRERAVLRQEKSQNQKEEFYGCFESVRHHEFVLQLRQVRDTQWFQGTAVGAIVCAGILVGIQLYELPQTAVDVLNVLDWIVLAVFTVELVVGMLCEGQYLYRFFLTAWNVFDFAIVVLGFMPIDARAVTALRLVRLLRVLRLVRALPQLRVLVMGLFGSLTSIVYIWLLLLMVFYLYAVLGVSLFRANDPFHFGELHLAMISLFAVATLEDWMDVFYTQFYGCDVYAPEIISSAGSSVRPEDYCPSPQAQPGVSVFYFISFVMLSSMVVLNLFVGVISTSISQAKNELTKELMSDRISAEEATEAATVHEESDALIEAKLNDLSELMSRITDEVEQFATLEKARKAVELAARIRDAHARNTKGGGLKEAISRIVQAAKADVGKKDGSTPTAVANGVADGDAAGRGGAASGPKGGGILKGGGGGGGDGSAISGTTGSSSMGAGGVSAVRAVPSNPRQGGGRIALPDTRVPTHMTLHSAGTADQPRDSFEGMPSLPMRDDSFRDSSHGPLSRAELHEHEDVAAPLVPPPSRRRSSMGAAGAAGGNTPGGSSNHNSSRRSIGVTDLDLDGARQGDRTDRPPSPHP